MTRAEALCETAVLEATIFEKYNFDQYVVSMKSSDVKETIESNNFEEEPEVIDEPVVEEEFESSVEEPILEEEVSEENDTTEPEENEGDLPASIKNDVKSVLLCMDQLLESLPEDKIMEFAKSEQFTTYKKLFKELGLSE